MPSPTKDWLLAKAASAGISPQEVAIQVLDARAERKGFPVFDRFAHEKAERVSVPLVTRKPVGPEE